MRQLALDYETIIDEVSVSDLVEAGHLVKDEYSGVIGANLNDIKFDKAKGDYDT